MSDEKKTGLELLREPFPAHLISKLPKPYKKESPKGKCPECGGWHGLPAAHLDYVGHAALTDRLLDCDPNWTWEPMSVGQDGLPALDRNGGLWIKLTVCGVTRLGYGDAQNRTGGDGVKEMIGDALRNAAMRFGAALDLWHKGEWRDEDDDKGDDHGKGDTGPGLKESVILDNLLAINEAASLPDLESAYKSAYRLAAAGTDAAAIKRFTEAKDARKKALPPQARSA